MSHKNNRTFKQMFEGSARQMVVVATKFFYKNIPLLHHHLTRLHPLLTHNFDEVNAGCFVCKVELQQLVGCGCFY